MEDLAPRICAALCCLGMYGLASAGTGYLVHRRTRTVEEQLGHPAVPPHHRALLFYAGASALWLSALVLAGVGLFKQEWTRLGRNCFLIFLAHMGGATAIALLQGKQPDPMMIVSACCAYIFASFLAMCVFVWRWGTHRIQRVEAGAATGPEPGAERWAVYLGSLLMGPLGLIAAFYYREPQDVRVGVTALRVSLVYLMLVTGAVCVGLPVFVAVMQSR